MPCGNLTLSQGNFFTTCYTYFMKKTLPLIGIILIAFGVIFWNGKSNKSATIITTFEECVAAGNPVMESYPEQCRAGGETFIRHIGNEVEKMDKIKLTCPRPGDTISSPITIPGEARATWYFEASFPIMITDWDGRIIGEGHAEAQSDWMTSEFVPFKAVVTFQNATTTYSNRGTLILKKDNPSGLPEHDDALEIPVVLK